MFGKLDPQRASHGQHNKVINTSHKALLWDEFISNNIPNGSIVTVSFSNAELFPCLYSIHPSIYPLLENKSTKINTLFKSCAGRKKEHEPD